MAALPYEGATSGDKALGDLQKILRAFGCQRFGSMADDAEGWLRVQFEYRGRQVDVKASTKGYAAAWLKVHPVTIYDTDRKSGRDVDKRRAHEAKAMQIAGVAVYSILRDWIKGQITAIETGVLSFEGAFLGQILLTNGRTVLEHVTDPKAPLLPQIEGPRP
jgi:hypothetical protein